MRFCVVVCAGLAFCACVHTSAEGPKPAGLSSAQGSAAEQSFGGAVPSELAAAQGRWGRDSGALSLEHNALGVVSVVGTNYGPPEAPASDSANAAPAAAGTNAVERLREALRAERYADARKELVAPEVNELPARSLIFGFVLYHVGEYEGAYRFLQQAKTEHPELASQVEPLRLRALLRSANYLASLKELESSRSVPLLLELSKRLLHDAQPDAALRVVQRAAGFSSGSKAWQAEVRALRAEIALARKLPFGAYADWRWLALHAPLEAAAEGSDDKLAEHFPKTALSAQERYARAVQFAEAGRVAAMDRELQRLQQTPRFQIRPGELLHLRGLAHYQARDYAGAAALLQEAAAAGSHQTIGDLYRAGQALSRLGRSREALGLFHKVLLASPKTSLTVAAKFRIGSELLVLGEWEQVIHSHDELLNKNPGNEFAEAAERERSVAWFATGQYARAAHWFRRMRMLHPKSSDAGLYQLLEAVSYEFAGQPEIAQGILRDLRLRSPLSYAGQTARARLLALGEVVGPVIPLPNTPKPSLPELPQAVQGLSQVGLDLLSEDALRGLEGQWLSPQFAARGWAQCAGYERLGTGRRRLVVGTDIASRAGFFNRPELAETWLWQCLYPDPFEDWVRQAAEQWQVSAALVYAVMRQESGFQPQVESPAKAKGLMQIIAPTARRIAEDLSEPVDLERLAVPRDNIRFGVFYLHKLLQRFNGHPVPTIAAYNAGPAAALRWQYATSELPSELFVARIPYDETRAYVQRVLGNLRVYQTLYPELGHLEVPLTLGSNIRTASSSSELLLDPDMY